MKFISKTEAYSFSILILSNCCDPRQTNPITMPQCVVIELTIERIKIAMENHEQDITALIARLEDAKQDQAPWVSDAIKTLQQDLERSDFKQTPEEKFENPLARRAESELALALLLNPTAAMMNAVGRVSIELLKFMHLQAIEWTSEWGPAFQESHHVIALGAFKEMPTFCQVEALLEKNDPLQLTEIMHLHFKFSANFTRTRPILSAPIRPPVGKLAEIIADRFNGETTSFHKKWITLKGKPGFDFRSYITNKIYESDLFSAEGERGRLASPALLSNLSNQLGLMLPHQEEEEKGLPTHDLYWIADCKNQRPNYESAYVIDLIENDAVYVSGPSGMTSALLGQMETLVNFESETLKKSYLSAIAAFIVGGGFHSLHEVIGPAQHILNLVPGYHVQVPQIGQMAKPPNYHVFFEQQIMIDPEFNALRNMAWKNYLRYFKEDYCPRHMKGWDLKLNPENIDGQHLEETGFFKVASALDIGQVRSGVTCPRP